MYDVLIIGAGPGGIFSAYELMERKPDIKIAVFEVGHQVLYSLQMLLHHERIRRSRCIF